MTRLTHLWNPIRHDHRLLRTIPKGQNTVLEYATDAARDVAIPSPGPNMVIWNKERNCIQKYDSGFGVWIGFSESDKPVAMDVTHRFQHMLPGPGPLVEYDDKVYCPHIGCYSDGTHLHLAERKTVGLPSASASTGPIIRYGSSLFKPDAGTGEYTSVLSTGTSFGGLGASLVDCGGNQVFFIEYDRDNRIFYSADGGDNWGNDPAGSPAYSNGSPIITAHVDAISHFHGGSWDSVASKLYVFTGDTNVKSSILVCDDIDHLVANPATWSDRWGLDGDRTVAGNELDEDYVLGHNNQKYRVVGLYFPGDGYGYAATDGASSDDAPNGYGLYLWRFNTTTLAEEWIYCHPPIDPSASYSPGAVAGTPWRWYEDSRGNLMCAVASEWSAGAGAYRVGNDEYLRLYMLTPDRRQAVEVWRTKTTNSDGSEVIVYPWSIVELNGLVIVSGYDKHPTAMLSVGSSAQVFGALGYGDFIDYEGVVGDFAGDTISRRHVAPPACNWIPNGRFLSVTTGWTGSNSTIARSTANVDGGNIASLAVPIDVAGSTAYAEYEFDSERQYCLQGKVLTLAARVLMPASQSASQRVGMYWITWNTEVSPQTSWFKFSEVSSDFYDGNWHDIFLTFFMPESGSYLKVRLYSSYGDGHADHDTIYFSDVRLGIGPLVLPEGAPPLINIDV